MSAGLKIELHAATLGFDRDREEVRLNPAFETMLGPDAARRWQDKAREILGRASINAAEVVEAFGELAHTDAGKLTSLPPKELRLKAGEDRITCSAALFISAFLARL